ncbi:replication protein A 70 kDa DNA-binding subunit A-like [Cannabis sativa]|uniref:replication protein A 70 kDa DNA-binding subunit A-like n=1 Tax=Cannabis sativa TaxID=3483 RepID=UPI0029CA7F64|nr:replication protein A 70 kDa DNA-binding subunit A-like [Cannabis sativa]
MNPQYKLLREITPSTRGWIAKVTVIEKLIPRISRNGVLYQRIILADIEKNRIQATLYGNAIHHFGDTLNVSQVYLISNAYIKPVQEEFRIVDNQFEWSLNTSTSIEETTDENQWNFEDLYNLYYLDQLDAYVDTKTSVDIVAVVLSADPIKKIHTKSGPANIQEFLLVDQSLQPKTLTMWDELTETVGKTICEILPQNPIIIGTRLKVVSHNG